LVASHLIRKPTLAESRLLGYLASKASGLQVEPGWITDLMVQGMADGGMGSLRLEAGTSESRVFGARVAECRFVDDDGVEVIASLNVDKQGRPFELDIWKTNFAPLIRIPDEFAS
jgi:hypothetical protein